MNQYHGKVFEVTDIFAFVAVCGLFFEIAVETLFDVGAFCF